MSNDGPKLYNTKPKKSQLKQQQQQQQQRSQEFTISPLKPKMESQPPTPPLPHVKDSFARRYKFVWPVLLTVNLVIGGCDVVWGVGIHGYIFVRGKKKDHVVEDDKVAVAVDAPSASVVTTVPSAVGAPSVSLIPERPLQHPPPAVDPAAVLVRDPIPEDQQRDLFKWILEEKRKVKPKDREEKIRIDEEKAILKEFIRRKSVPSL
ncbi:hypothetical protein GIB67_005895 [Kingdonia uniflora]|uniref:Transmembrane protein n=1 Tax=Kingdonia uniflora TaxID=39325 RepID=A0A7J7MBH5_9MAGN|nr:hypothetical protein GIB67_005895 [Kingdonia uniflora]